MANAFKAATRTWVIDTAGATVIDANFLRIKRIKAVGMTTAGHQALIQDQNGNEIWSAFATGANYESEMNGVPAGFVNGLKVPTLASGQIEVELV